MRYHRLRILYQYRPYSQLIDILHTFTVLVRRLGSLGSSLNRKCAWDNLFFCVSVKLLCLTVGTPYIVVQ